MFSNDQNIETIAQLVEVLKRYIATKSDLWRIDITEKIVKLFTIMAMFFTLSFILVLVLIYLSFTIAYALSTFIGLSFAFLTVTCVYIVIFLLCILNRRRWIERPLVRILADLLRDLQGYKDALNKQIETDEKEIKRLWNSLFKPAKSGPKTPTQRIQSAISLGTSVIDGVILGWKLYRKFKK